MRGVLAGAVGLLVLHALVARANQSQLSGLTRTATGLVNRFLDPAHPALPDRSAEAAAAAAPVKPVTGGTVTNLLYPAASPRR